MYDNFVPKLALSINRTGDLGPSVMQEKEVGRKAEEGAAAGVVEVCVELIMAWVLDIIQNPVMLHLRLFKVEMLR